MINIDLPDNKSIIVFSSFRTRSTALCDWIAQEKGLTNFDEAFVYVERAISFVNFINRSSGNFVAKVMCSPHQYTPDTQQFLKPLLNQCTLIRLHRRNVFAQITSFYIAAVTNQWHFVKKHTYRHPLLAQDCFTGEIPIDTAELRNAAISILTTNQRLQAINTRFDLELVSEDLGVLPSNFQIIPSLANQDQLNTALQTLIDSDSEVHNLYHNRQDFSHFGK
jgi:hypothetical protein